MGKGGISSYKRGEQGKGGKGAELHIGYSYLYNTNRLVRAGRRINLPVSNVATCVAKVNSCVFSQFLFKFFIKCEENKVFYEGEFIYYSLERKKSK